MKKKRILALGLVAGLGIACLSGCNPIVSYSKPFGNDGKNAPPSGNLSIAVSPIGAANALANAASDDAASGAAADAAGALAPVGADAAAAGATDAGTDLFVAGAAGALLGG